MTVDRHLDWDGCVNVRDLGGLVTADGHESVRGAVVRADNLDHLTSGGWAAFRAYGIQTVIDLRDASERAADVTPRPPDLTVVQEPLEDLADHAFWDARPGLKGTPLYFRDFLNTYPERCGAVLAAVAQAPPGGLVIHCAAGRDRTGLVVMLLLAVAGVVPRDIAVDYDISTERLRPLLARLKRTADEDRIADTLSAAAVSAHDVIVNTLASLDVGAYLSRAGLSNEQVWAIKARLLGPD